VVLIISKEDIDQYGRMINGNPTMPSNFNEFDPKKFGIIEIERDLEIKDIWEILLEIPMVSSPLESPIESPKSLTVTGDLFYVYNVFITK
jgi:hypothetical protein